MRLSLMLFLSSLFGTSQFRWDDIEQRSLAHRIWILLQRIEGIYRATSFGNLLIFLNMSRAVSFEYMNRQLVWNEFSIPFLVS
ncbi:hypothetical protein Ahy_A04g019536 [Arachis hypogaea]|uniref:Secreted protein n=1 Tax=Arachis hypogaea TaxID=3818 RepID=A0A445DG32_ARAHY|nr:hypothetical protein Ahy_A04g019536 [Arachis hypogaea]